MIRALHSSMRVGLFFQIYLLSLILKFFDDVGLLFENLTGRSKGSSYYIDVNKINNMTSQ